MKLDIGCGNRPMGDVNCDLFSGYTPHLHEGQNYIDPKKIPNFVRCDAHYLPFRSHCFHEVFSDNMLEHLDSPMVALKEMVRCSKDKVTFIVPHRYARNKLGFNRHENCKEHKHFFNVTVVNEWLNRLGLKHDIQVRYREVQLPFIRKFLRKYLSIGFKLPWDIVACMHVGLYEDDTRVELEKTLSP